MPRRKRERAAPETEPGKLTVLMEEHLLWMQTQNFSGETVTSRRSTIGYFIEWCQERGIDDPGEITRPVLERYQRSLYQYRKQNGQPLTFRTQSIRLRSVKGFFRWLARHNHILHNPASELILPRLENRLPKYVLTAGEAEQVIAQPDIATPQGLRDRAILETFYATGARRMEIANLKLYDLDADRGTVMIRQGKGRKDRHIPIGQRALQWIDKYVREARPALVTGSEDATLFLTDVGEPFHRIQLTTLVRRYLAKARTGKMGGCHLWRHTVATLMLENGADVRVIQELLGHARLSTTELYTRVSINLLKQVYGATHPAAQALFDTLAAEKEADDV